MREKERRQQPQKLGFAYSGIVRYWLSTIYRPNKLAFVTYLQFHDGGTGTGQFYISNKEFSHRVAIIIVSFGAFATGIRQLLGG